MLKSLNLHGVGPVHDLEASFGDRMNIFTGDNGLGKSFLLDVCFYTLTGTWPGNRMAIPDQEADDPKIKYEIASKTRDTKREASYDFQTGAWTRQRGRPPMPGLVIYAAVDGSFSVWDPARNYWRDTSRFGLSPPPPLSSSSSSSDCEELEESDFQWPRAFQFPPESWSDHEDMIGAGASGPPSRPIRRDVANGLEEGGHVLCSGLIADWNEWYYQRDSKPPINAFEYLEKVVSVLSHPSELMHCGEPQEGFSEDVRKFPTLKMPYGVVPYSHWSAGVKRIVNLAYLMVWSWTKHLVAAKKRRVEPTDRIVIIIDEVEAHLHPKWQRTILPAILQVANKLREDISVQMFASTHSPLVMASMEPHFQQETDQFFNFDLTDDKVTLENPDWANQGDIVAWLTSETFGLEQARSREAELAIESAEAFMRDEFDDLPEGLKTHQEIEESLKNLLPGMDPFWPRWIVEAKP